MAISEVTIKVIYDSKDISADITKYLTSLSYSDKTEGESDEIQINLEDSPALWRGAWYPSKGATLSVFIGYNDGMLDCGEFEIDEIELSGPPDTVSIKALATGIKGTLRTKKSAAHENKTIGQIAEAVAKANGLTVQGTIEPIVINRRTQNRETDLSFLKNLASEFGYMFSIRGNKLIFTHIFDIENLAAITSIDRTKIINYSIKDKTSETYTDAKVSYQNPDEGETVDYNVTSVNNKDGVPFSKINTGDTLVINSKTENKQQAEAKAKAALYQANSLQQEGNITVQGNPYLVAGMNFKITGMGKMSGTWHIKGSTHNIDKGGGYTVDLEIKRVAEASGADQKASPVVSQPEYKVTQFKNRDNVTFNTIQ
jgi:phage protein D